MNSEQPLVSIVIPSYNKADLLIEMVDSIIKQTYSNWELTIVDDGSEEIEFSKIQSFLENDERCHLLSRNREPKNGNTCRNIGMESSHGDFLLFFDSDDLITPICIENRVLFMQAHPECDYSSFPYAVFQNGDQSPFLNGEKRFKKVPEAEIISNILKVDYPFTVWSNIYRKSSILSLNLKWDERIYVYQDFDFMLMSALSNLKHAYSDGSPDYYYRQFKKGNNVSGNYVSDIKIQSSYYLFSKALSFLDKRFDSEDRKKDITSFIYTHIERLIKACKYTETEAFVKMLSMHYERDFVSRIEAINHRCKKIKSYKRRQICLHYMLYKASGIRLFKLLFFHEVIKSVIPFRR